jgi:hypothetical protein
MEKVVIIFSKTRLEKNNKKIKKSQCGRECLLG